MTFIPRSLFRHALPVLTCAALAVGCTSTSGDALARHATRAAQAGDWSQASKHWNDVLKLRGEGDVEATVGYAEALRRTGQAPLARLVLERAVNRTPRYEQAPFWMAMAELEADLDRQDARLRALEAALESDPELVDGWVALGRYCSEAGQASQALAHFQRATALDPTHVAALDRTAALARELDQPLTEFRALARRLEHEPMPQADLMRAVDLSLLDEVVAQHGSAEVERQRWLERAVAQDPQDPRAHLLLGRQLLDAGQAESADPLLSRAAELDPGDADALHALVICLRATGQDSRASSVLDHALRVTPVSEHDRFRSLTVE